MSKFIKRATITIDEIARELFKDPDKAARHDFRGYGDILEELQRHLQDKGDDPGYARVVFAADGQDHYLEINEHLVVLSGVFPRIMGIRDVYGDGNIVIKRSFDTNIRDTLVVVDKDSVGDLWKKELSALGYQIREI